MGALFLEGDFGRSAEWEVFFLTCVFLYHRVRYLTSFITLLVFAMLVQ